MTTTENPTTTTATCDACHVRPAGEGHFGLYCLPCSELPYGVAAPVAETTRARCYMEFCCNTATRHVAIQNRSGNPDLEAIAWGWCAQHVSDAWEHRAGHDCTDCTD